MASHKSPSRNQNQNLIHEARNLSQQINSLLKEIDDLNNFSSLHKEQGELEVAQKYTNKSIEKSQKVEALLLNLIDYYTEVCNSLREEVSTKSSSQEDLEELDRSMREILRELTEEPDSFAQEGSDENNDDALQATQIISSFANLFARHGNYEVSIKTYKQLIRASLDDGNYVEVAKGYFEIGKLDYFYRQNKRALESLQKAIEAIEEEDKKDDSTKRIYLLYFRAETNRYLGEVSQELNQCEKALDYFRKAIELYADSPKHPSSKAWALAGLGSAYIKQKKYAEAHEKLDEASQIFVSQEDLEGQAEILNRIGNLYSSQEEITKAESYYERSLNMIEEQPVPRYNLGLIELNRKNYDKALNYFRKALELYNSSAFEKNFNNRCLTCLCLGETLKELGITAIEHSDLENAECQLSEAYAILEELREQLKNTSEQDDYLLTQATQECSDVYRRLVDIKRNEFALGRGNFEENLAFLRQMLRTVHEANDKLGEAKALLGLGDIYLLAGCFVNPENQGLTKENVEELIELKNASDAYQYSLKLFDKLNLRDNNKQEKLRGKAECLMGLGKLHHALGNIDEAMNLIGKAKLINSN